MNIRALIEARKRQLIQRETNPDYVLARQEHARRQAEELARQRQAAEASRAPPEPSLRDRALAALRAEAARIRARRHGR